MFRAPSGIAWVSIWVTRHRKRLRGLKIRVSVVPSRPWHHSFKIQVGGLRRARSAHRHPERRRRTRRSGVAADATRRSERPCRKVAVLVVASLAFLAFQEAIRSSCPSQERTANPDLLLSDRRPHRRQERWRRLLSTYHQCYGLLLRIFLVRKASPDCYRTYYLRPTISEESLALLRSLSAPKRE